MPLTDAEMEEAGLFWLLEDRGITDPVVWLKNVQSGIEDGSWDFDPYPILECKNVYSQFLGRETQIVRNCGILIRNEEDLAKVAESTPLSANFNSGKTCCICA